MKIKRILAFILAVAIIVTAVPATSLTAKAAASGYYTYYVSDSDGTAYIYKVDTSISGDVIIPSTLGGYTVTKISSSAFKGCSKITSLTVPESITTIGQGAFSGCSNLQSITIPFIGNCVKTPQSAYQYPFGYIFGTEPYTGGEYTFQDYYGSSTTTATHGAYYIPTSLKTVVVTGGNVLYGAFSGCDNLTSITLEDNVTSIGTNAFYLCNSLTKINIENDEIEINDDAFYQCRYLTYRTYSNGKYLGNTNNPYLIFVDTVSTDITTCEINKNTKIISYDAFYDCSKLSNITIPNGVKRIGTHAFVSCSSLTKITIPDSVISIGYGAFSGCEGLTSMTIPFVGEKAKNSLDIHQYPFGYIFGTGYYTGYYAASQSYYNENITSTETTTYYIPPNLKSVTVTGGNILYGAFSNCRSLTDIRLHSDVTNIGDYAFAGCSGITDDFIPSGIQSIGSHAFENCSGLVNVTIPDSVTDINDFAFYKCENINTIYIGANLANLGDYVFDYCNKLTSFTVSPDNMIFGSHNGVLFDKDCTNLIAYPMGIVGVYEIPNDVKILEENAFLRCRGLTELIIPRSLEVINQYAFSDCYSLTDVWYRGTATDKTQISISSIGHPYLLSAVWHYNTCETHIYSGDCDETCNNCEWMRDNTVAHIFEWYIDKNSNCGAEGYKHEECIVCHAKRNENTVIQAVGNHTYDDVCDEICNICNSARDDAHSFEWVVDKENNCGIDGYKHEECTVCHVKKSGNTIIPATGNHSYDDKWDTECNVCQSVREVSDATNGDYTYRISDGKVTIVDCDTSISGEIVIPSTFEGCPVITIDDFAFERCKYITKITVPESVTSVGMNAFAECESLAEVIIPSGVSYLGDGAFYCCFSLKKITLPSNITRINGYTFYCTPIEEITIPSSVTYVGLRAFGECIDLSQITILGDAENCIFENGAFEAAEKLTDVWCTCPEFDLSIIYDYRLRNAQWHFNTCSSEHVYENKWDETCNNCEMKRDVPDAKADYYTYRMDNGEWTIISCDTSLSGDVILPSAFEGYPVTAIAESAFENCNNLINITIPSSIISIGNNVFAGCSSLERFAVSEDNQNYCSISGILYNKEQTQIICTPENHKLIFRVNYLYSTGEKAFDSIEKLVAEGETYSVSVPVIEYHSGSVENIFGTMLEDLTIDVIYYENAKWNSGDCNNNISWTLYEDGTLIFRGTGAMPDYTGGNTPWYEHADKVKTVYIDPRITRIGAYAFENCSNLTFIDYGYSITSIGEYAFSGCAALKSFKLPETVTKISEGAFYECTGLRAVVIPDNITLIDNNAFYGCDELIQVTVGGAVTAIGDDAFADCEKLTQVYFRGKPATLGNNSFGIKTGKYVYYYSTTNGWSNVITDGLWNGYTAIPYNAISKENFNGTNVYIVKVVDKHNTPLKNAIVNLGGNVQSTNEDGMAYFVKLPGAQSLSVSCSDHIAFTDSDFKASTTQLMDIIELSDRPSVVQGVRVNGDSIATSVKIINCSTDETVTIAVNGYSKYSILKYELYQGNRLIATQKTNLTSCIFSVKANAFEEEETIFVKMYTSDGYMVAAALNIDTIKLANISEQQILDELSQLELSFSLGNMGSYKLPVSFKSNGEEKFYTTISGRTIRVGINLDIAEFFEKNGENAPKSALQKMVDDSMKNFAKGSNPIEYNICGYLEIEYLGNGEYYVKTNYVKLGVKTKLSFNAQASYFGVVGVYFKAGLSGESTLDMKITRYEPESGFGVEDLNFAMENELSIEGGAYLLWGIGSAGLYGKAQMGFVLGIIPEVEFESVYITGEFGAKWSVLWGWFSGNHVIASGNIYRWPEAQTYMLRLLSSSLYEAQQNPNSYEFNNRTYLENRSEWLSGEYLQKNIYDNVAPKIVTCGDTTIMFWLDDNSERDNSNFQTLYYSIYTNGIWSEPKPVDDNGTFDCEFDVYTDGEKIYVVYTEMTEQNLSIESLDISDDSAISSLINNVEVSVVVYENGVFGTPVQLTDNSECEILPDITMIDGELTVVWVQTDSIGLDGQSTDNTIYSVNFSNDGWSKPTAFVDNQNFISDITVVTFNNVAYTVYIVDADGSSETKDDQVLVLCDENGNFIELDAGLIANVSCVDINGKTALAWYNNGKIYMITASTQQPVCLIPENISVGTNYHFISISEEETLLTFIMSNYEESGNSSGGTDIYGVYIDENGYLTSPVRLTETEGYVVNYSVIYEEDKLLIVFTETFADVSGDDVDTVTHLRNVALELFTDISLDGIDFDITDAKENTELDFTLSISNKGTHHVDGITVNLYNASGQLLYTTDCDIILESGVSENCNVSLVLPQSISSEGYIIEILPKYGMAEANDIDYTDNITEISLAYVDFSVEAEQKIIGEKNYIILSVSNDGNVSSTAKIEIYVPNTDGRMITSVETEVIAPGSTEQYFVELNALTSDEDDIVTCIVTSEIGDFYLINNTQTVSLLHINDNVFVADPEQVIHNPEISVNTATFDKYFSQDIVLEITNEVDSFSGIEGLVLNSDYTLSGNIVTISNNYMTNLGIGIHTLKFLFDYGYEEPTVRTLSITVIDSTPIVLNGSICISGDVVVGNTVYADLSDLKPATNKLIYTWSINGVTVSTMNYYSIKTQDYGKTLILKITGTDGFVGEFIDEIVVEKRKPIIPIAPIISKIGSTTFGVIKSEGVEYSIDLVTWQDSNIFEELLPNKTYTVYARKKATETSYASDISSGTTLTTAKLTVSAPSVPELQSSTYDTITLVYDSDMEYKIEGGDWIDSNVFTGLEPNTTYIIYQRYKETDIAYASEYSTMSFTTADRITISGSITVVGEPQYGETLAVDLTNFVGDLNSVSYQWFADGIEIAGAVQNTYTVTSDDMGKIIEVKVIGTGAYKGELTATISIRDYVIGDMDGDNVITIRDATILRRYVAKWEGVTVNELAADVNNDGVVNIRDATVLRRYVAKWEGYEKLLQVG